MKFYNHGNGSQTAILLHGMASYAGAWGNLINDLSENDYAVITVDLPGHGNADKNIDSYMIENWEQQLITNAPKVDLIIGHSIGGLLALRSRNILQAKRTIAIDPLLRFPTGLLSGVTRKAFLLSQLAIGLRAEGFQKDALALWDRQSIIALERAKGIPKLDENVLILRPKGSFVAPLSLLRKNENLNVIAFEKVGHNLHRDNYPLFWDTIINFIKT